MAGPTARFSEALRLASAERVDMLDSIEEDLKYCQSIPEVELIRDAEADEDKDWKKYVTFAIHLFAHTSLRRMEQLILSLISESNAFRLDAAIIIARAIMEGGAAIHYAYKMAEAHKRNGKRKDMDKNLHQLLMGANTYKNHRGTTRPVHVDVTLGKVDDDSTHKSMREQYKWLSEFAHPNGPALLLLHQTLREKPGVMCIKKVMPMDQFWAMQIYTPVAYLLDLSVEGWKWMLKLDWKEK